MGRFTGHKLSEGDWGRGFGFSLCCRLNRATCLLHHQPTLFYLGLFKRIFRENVSLGASLLEAHPRAMALLSRQRMKCVPPTSWFLLPEAFHNWPYCSEQQRARGRAVEQYSECVLHRRRRGRLITPRSKRPNATLYEYLASNICYFRHGIKVCSTTSW